MIAYELNKPLNHFFQTALNYIDEEFRSCEKYLLEGDDIIALGYEYSLRMSFTDRGLYTVEGFEEWEQYMPMELPLYEEETLESELIKYVYTVFRRWQEIPPYADDHMHRVLLRKLNQKLTYYNLRILIPEEIFEIYYCSERITLEQALVTIMQRDMRYHVIEVVRSDYEEAERLRHLGRHHDALPYYRNVMNEEDLNSNLYTLAAFGLGEVYHFENQLEKSAETYMLCNIAVLPDHEELYRRLGHALLDERLKEYGEMIKIYYRSTLSVQYRNKHKQELEEVVAELKENFDEYEATCVEIGMKKYSTR